MPTKNIRGGSLCKQNCKEAVCADYKCKVRQPVQTKNVRGGSVCRLKCKGMQCVPTKL